MAFSLFSISSSFDPNSLVFTVTDQIGSPSTIFSMRDSSTSPASYANLVSVQAVNSIPGLNISIQKNAFNFSMQITMNPSIPLGGQYYDSLIDIVYEDPDFGNVHEYMHISIRPLLYKINYYDNALLDGDGNARLVRSWIANGVVSDKGLWLVGSTYSLGDVVNYNSKKWTSLSSSNTGNTPSDTTPYWTRFPVENINKFKGNWSSGDTYSTDDVVLYNPGDGNRPWICLKNSNLNHNPSESIWWTSIPVDDLLHVGAAKDPSSKTECTRLWAKVYFSRDVSGLISNPVFYANGNFGAGVPPVTPTGILLAETGSVYTTKLGTPSSPTPYEARLSDSTISVGGDGTFYLSFSYTLSGVNVPPVVGPKLNVVREIGSTFSSSSMTITGNTVTSSVITGTEYNLKVDVTGHDASLVSGTNYANLFYRRADYSSGADPTALLPVTTDSAQPVYALYAPSNIGGTSSYQIKFTSSGSFYFVGRPTGDLNMASTTLQPTTPKALRVDVGLPASTAFSLTLPSPVPPSGSFDVAVNQINVTPGNLTWTLKAFNGVSPYVQLFEVGNPVPLATTNTANDTNVTWVSGKTYYLKVVGDSPPSKTYTDILKLTNNTTGAFSYATLTYTRSSSLFYANPDVVTVTQGVTGGTINVVFSGLGVAIDAITAEDGSGTLTIPSKTFTSAISGNVAVNITQATTQNSAGYSVTLRGRSGGVGGTIQVSTNVTIKVVAPTGKPSVTTYEADKPFLCQVTAGDTDTTVCGGWHDNMKKHKPGATYDVSNPATYNIHKLYLLAFNDAGNPTLAGQYSVDISVNGTSFTNILAAQVNATDVNSGDFTYNSSTFIHLEKINDITYPLAISINASTTIKVPYVYIRIGFGGNYSVPYKIYCIPNIKIVNGTVSALPSHTATIETNSGAFFQVNTEYDGYASNTLYQYWDQGQEVLYVSFPDTPTYITGTWDLSQRGSKSSSNGGSLSYNLFFQTNSVTGAQPLFIACDTSTGRVLIYRASLTIVDKASSALKLSGGGTSSVIQTTIGATAAFTATNIDKLYFYRHNSQADATSYVLVTNTPSSQRYYNVLNDDVYVYVVASAGNTVVGALKYVVTGLGCTLTATPAFLSSSFNLPTASVNDTYPANLNIGGVKLPSVVEVTQNGTTVKKSVSSDGSGWQFLSANYGSQVVLEVTSSNKEIRLAAAPTAFNFQITQAANTTDYRLALKSSPLTVGSYSVGSDSLTIVFKATFSDGTCATMSRDLPIRDYIYVPESVATPCLACDYFPPSAAGSLQYDCGTGYSEIEEVIVNGIGMSASTFISAYGLSMIGNILSTGAVSTPLKYASLPQAYYGFSDSTYSIYVIVKNTNVTNNKKSVLISYSTSVVTPPNYLPFPDKIGLTPSPSGTSLSCFEGDKVYISLKSTVPSAPIFVDNAYDLIFIEGTNVKVQDATYNVSTKTFDFIVPSGGFFTSGTAYKVGLKHLTTECVYLSTITLTSGGPKPSGKIDIVQPPEQEPCVGSITISGTSSTGTSLSGVTRVQIYKTSAGTLPYYIGDVSVWDDIKPTIGASGKDITFTLDNSTKYFASTITDPQSAAFFVDFYTGGPGNYSKFEEKVPLTLRLKNPTLIPAQSNPREKISYTTPIPTLYENILSVTCSSCKTGACGTTDLATVSGITWEFSSAAPPPNWLSLTPNYGGGNNYNKALLSGSPDSETTVNFGVIVTVPYYIDANNVTVKNVYTFNMTLTPTAEFIIGPVTLEPNAVHYQAVFSHTLATVNKPSGAGCTSLTWAITDRELTGADKALPPSTVDSPITLSNGGVFTWENVDDPDAVYPVTYKFGVQAQCNDGSIATGDVTLTVDPRVPKIGSVTPPYGYFDLVNDTVTIRGLDLYPGMVKFGNSEATNILVNVTNDALTCTPPVVADIGGEDLTVSVVVYNSDGGASVEDVYYTYQRKRNPIITAVIPSGGTFRGGTKVAIIGANFEPTSTVIIDDVQQPILAVTPTSIVFVTMPHSVGQATIHVTNSVPPVSTAVYNFAAEPKVTAVQPYNLPADGGIDVYILGTDFQYGVRVFLDDYEIPSDRITVL